MFLPTPLENFALPCGKKSADAHADRVVLRMFGARASSRRAPKLVQVYILFSDAIPVYWEIPLRRKSVLLIFETNTNWQNLVSKGPSKEPFFGKCPG